jgi:hypothetical protein
MIKNIIILNNFGVTCGWYRDHKRDDLDVDLMSSSFRMSDAFFSIEPK